jgi:uncharacterized protein (TIGR02569 family)
MELTKDVVNSFNLKGDRVALLGGQNTSVRIGDAVLKPVAGAQHYEWLLSLINSLTPEGYRMSKPIKSKNGTFVCDGWICTQFERGEDRRGRIEEKLEAARLFHRDLSNVCLNTYPKIDNPWSRAHRIAWQVDDLPNNMPKLIHMTLERLLGKVILKDQDHYKMQIVHSDLSGNILFDDVLSPLIIDFSPTIAPVEYAEAILVCDCIAWQGSPISEIELLPNNKMYKEMIIRAILFRLSVSAIFAGADSEKFLCEYNSFKPILEKIG